MEFSFRRGASWADGLTALRVLLCALTYPVVLRRDVSFYVVLVLLIVATDVLDGPLARRVGRESRWGSNLDSFADYVFYISLLVWSFFWLSDLVISRWPLVVGFLVAYTLVLVLGYRARGLAGYHNRYSRAAATAGVFFSLWFVIYGPSEGSIALLVVLLVVDLTQRVVGLVQALRRGSSL